jgi:hypothetical protein
MTWYFAKYRGDTLTLPHLGLSHCCINYIASKKELKKDAKWPRSQSLYGIRLFRLNYFVGFLSHYRPIQIKYLKIDGKTRLPMSISLTIQKHYHSIFECS